MNGGRLESWLRCPCCVRRAEHMVKTMRRRVTSALAAAALAALAALCLSGGPVQAEPAAGSARLTASGASPWWSGGPGRVALIAIAVAAVAAFAALQVIARSRHRRPPIFADWRAWPPGYDPDTGTCAEPPGWVPDRRGVMTSAPAALGPRPAACLRYVCQYGGRLSVGARRDVSVAGTGRA